MTNSLQYGYVAVMFEQFIAGALNDTLNRHAEVHGLVGWRNEADINTCENSMLLALVKERLEFKLTVSTVQPCWELYWPVYTFRAPGTMTLITTTDVVRQDMKNSQKVLIQAGNAPGENGWSRQFMMASICPTVCARCRTCSQNCCTNAMPMAADRKVLARYESAFPISLACSWSVALNEKGESELETTFELSSCSICDVPP